METSSQFFESEIDLRAVAQTLLRYKWLIILVPVALALAAFLLSRFALARQYQATALLITTKPALTANFDPRIQTSPQLPEAKTLTDLASADGLLKALIQTPEITPLLEEGATVQSLRSHLDAELIGTSQLRLTVTDSDPLRAAKIADVWAQLLADRLNNLFGTGTESLEQIETQIQQAYDNWSQKEAALVEKLPGNQADALQVRLDQARSALTAYLNKIRDLDLVTSDAQNLNDRLKIQNSSDQLSIEDSLSLIALFQRSASGDGGASPSLQLQVSGTGLPGGQYTVSQARGSLDEFIKATQTQRQQLQAQADKLHTQITDLGVQLEKAQYEKTQLTVQRDLALTTYQALNSQAEEARIALNQQDQTAKVASFAEPPERPSGPRSLVNAVIAALIGGLFVTGFVLVREWWRAPGSFLVKPQP